MLKYQVFELIIVCAPISDGVVLKTAAGSTVLGASGVVGWKPVCVEGVLLEVLVVVCAAGVVNCVVLEVIINVLALQVLYH